MRSLVSTAHSSLASPGSRSRLPLRPRFLHELVVIPLEDGVVIEGTNQPCVLEGDAARILLPTLVPLMDGTRTMDELRRQLPNVRAADIHSTVSLLFSWGLIEDDAAGGTNRETDNRESVGFLRRYVGVGGIHRNGREAYEALRASEVMLVGAGPGCQQIDILKSLLLQSGIGSVMTLRSESLPAHQETNEGATPRSLIVSVCFDKENYQQLAHLDDWCHVNGRSWLRAVLDETRSQADIGPLFNQASACYRCFEALHCSSSFPKQFSASGTDTDTNARFLISLLAVSIIYWFSDLGPTLRWRDFQRYQLPEWESRNLRCARVPGCSRCRPCAAPAAAQSADPSQTPIDASVVFEDYVGLPIRPRSPQGAEQVSSEIIAELSRQTTRLANCSQLALNRSMSNRAMGTLDALCQRESYGSRTLTIDDLATILMMTGGIRNLQTGHGKLQRWCATAGNLGSVELFLAVRQVSGLPPGIYFYQPGDHSLAWFQLNQKALDITDLMRRVAFPAAEALPDLLVLFTGAFHRVARKYSHFGYRLLHLDAGVAASQLHLLAGSLNIYSRTVTRWADDLVEEQLNLSPIRQQLTAIVALWGRHCPPADSSSAQGPLRTGSPSSTIPIRQFCDRSVQNVFEMLFRESRIQEHALCVPPFEIPRELRNVHEQRLLVKPLPPPGQGGRSVTEILTERTSVRHYASNRVSLDQIGSMLYCAHVGDLADWPQEHAEGQALSFLVLASRVQELSPGVYAYTPGQHALGLLRPALAVDKMVELFVQPEFSSAPVVMWIAGNLAAACARHGAFGHRQLLLRAGAASNRLWAAAMGMGLVGCIVAGVVPGAARQHLGLDGYQHASLIAFSAGNCETQRSRNPGSQVPLALRKSIEGASS